MSDNVRARTKRAFLVVGPESSGTKFVTGLFLKAGCQGDGRHQQRWDTIAPKGSPLVYRRSYPHGGEWPDLAAIAERFSGYEIRLIVCIRSLQFTVASRKRHAKGNLQGNAVAALQMIAQQWQETSLPGVWLTYEALVKYPGPTIGWLFNWCGLPTPRGVVIKDGNKKYVN